MIPYTIRNIIEKDLDQLIELCAAHAAYEECDYSYENKKEQLSKALFSKTPQLYASVVEGENHELLGYMTYMKQYSTWDAESYIYLDCLYLSDVCRSQGIGEILIRQLQTEAKNLSCKIIQWQTPDFNVRAIKFYKRIGAISKSKERFFLTV